MRIVVDARIVFERAKPRFPEEHRHFKIVSLDLLVKALLSEEGQKKMSLSSRQTESLVETLEQLCVVPSVQSRRATLFPRLKQFRKQHLEGVTEEDEGYQEVSELTIGGASHSKKDDSQSKTEEESGQAIETKLSLHKSSVASTVTQGSKGSAVKRLATTIVGGSRRKLSSETDVSFSVFLQCLHIVKGESVLHSSRRRSQVFASGEFEMPSSYLH